MKFCKETDYDYSVMKILRPKLKTFTFKMADSHRVVYRRFWP